MPSATPEELAGAIIDCVDAGARVISLSVAFGQPSAKSSRTPEQSLDYALHRGTILVAAAGNQGMVGGTPLTRHPGVVPVVAYDLQGRLLKQSNLGNSIGRRGVGAPGAAVASLSTRGEPVTSEGTSVSAPFVTGAIAMLSSEFPRATTADLMNAVKQSPAAPRRMVVPPLMDAWQAHRSLASAYSERAAA
jgi:subtilisin family serine protease